MFARHYTHDQPPAWYKQKEDDGNSTPHNGQKKDCEILWRYAHGLFHRELLPRGSGKTTLLKSHFSGPKVLWLDLLLPTEEDRFQLDPELLLRILENKDNEIEWVVIDEVQKVPKLLDVVHSLLESGRGFLFALTGSSSRRLKQKGTNLLAGRAFTRSLLPLTGREIPRNTNLDLLLKWGSLPKIFSFETDEDRADFLHSYTLTYVKSEIQAEQWVRKLEPFRRFLPVAAQMNGKILNYSSIAKDVGVDDSTIKSYYKILQDTLLGFELPAYHRSIRKQQRQASKFYFCDTGIKRALERKLSLDLNSGTSEYGFAFEHWIILEIYRHIQYFKRDYELSYFMSQHGVEIDLIIDRPGQPPVLVEIKSTEKVREEDASALTSFKKDFPNSDLYVLSRDQQEQVINGVQCVPWHSGISKVLSLISN